MTLENVACNQCGAPLAIPDAAKFVSCNHCGANLAVRRNESVTYTERVEELAEQTADLAEQVAHLRYQNELERIEREWQQEREKFVVTDKHGGWHEPSAMAATVVSVLVIGFGVFWTIMAAGMFPPFALFGLFFVGFAIYGMLSTQRKAREYQQAYEAYKHRRARLSIADFFPANQRGQNAPSDAT
jgi:hypothetical protein